MRKLTTSILTAITFLFVIQSCSNEECPLPNQPPTAEAGPSKIIQLPVSNVTLIGSGTSPNGSISSYLWNKVSGPNNPTIVNPVSATTVINNLVAGVYVFQLRVTDNLGLSATDTTSVTVTNAQIQTLTLQPSASDCDDAFVHKSYNCATGSTYFPENSNFGSLPELPISSWTYNANGCGTGNIRSLIKFNQLSQIPSNANLISAKLSFYGLTTSLALPQGNSSYPNSPYSGTSDNDCWIQRVTTNWNENTVTWNNQPTSTISNQVSMPVSTSQWNHNVETDVTNLIKDILISSEGNNGFIIKLRNENYYRCQTFGSSDNNNASLRPKLTVVYTN
jgi:hypothetical protein